MENAWIKENERPGDGRLLFRIRLEASNEENKFVCVSIEDMAPFKKLQQFVCDQLGIAFEKSVIMTDGTKNSLSHEHVLSAWPPVRLLICNTHLQMPSFPLNPQPIRRLRHRPVAERRQCVHEARQQLPDHPQGQPVHDLLGEQIS